MRQVKNNIYKYIHRFAMDNEYHTRELVGIPLRMQVLYGGSDYTKRKNHPIGSVKVYQQQQKGGSVSYIGRAFNVVSRSNGVS